MKAIERLLWVIIAGLMLGLGLMWPRGQITAVEMDGSYGRYFMVTDRSSVHVVWFRDGRVTVQQVYPEPTR